MVEIVLRPNEKITKRKILDIIIGAAKDEEVQDFGGIEELLNEIPEDIILKYYYQALEKTIKSRK